MDTLHALTSVALDAGWGDAYIAAIWILANRLKSSGIPCSELSGYSGRNAYWIASRKTPQLTQILEEVQQELGYQISPRQSMVAMKLATTPLAIAA